MEPFTLWCWTKYRRFWFDNLSNLLLVLRSFLVLFFWHQGFIHPHCSRIRRNSGLFYGRIISNSGEWGAKIDAIARILGRRFKKWLDLGKETAPKLSNRPVIP